MPDAQHIMQIIANETHGESYSTAKYCLDSVRVPYIEYDDAERKIEAERAETERCIEPVEMAHRGYVDIGRRAEEIRNDEPLLWRREVA